MEAKIGLSVIIKKGLPYSIPFQAQGVKFKITRLTDTGYAKMVASKPVDILPRDSVGNYFMMIPTELVSSEYMEVI